MSAEYPIVTIRKNEERRIAAGHPWAFSNELTVVPSDIEPGTIVRLRTESGREIGTGFYNPHSLIAVRILSRELGASIDDEFFRTRIRASISRRKHLLSRRNGVRIIHGESDELPGLIVDKYNDLLALQITSAGFEPLQGKIVEILSELLSPAAIVEKNLSHLRKREGLEEREGMLTGDTAATIIHDAAGTQFEINLLQGQKTGFFLDQMENRVRIRDFIQKGSCALDLFCNEGGFALNAALAGAEHVTAVDSSAYALEQVRANAERNGADSQIETVKRDCFQFLTDVKETFDLIVVDPPALIRSKKELGAGKKAYLQLNTKAMSATKPEGILVTASCSHHLTREYFLDILTEAQRKSGRRVQILEERGAGIDHPVLLNMQETRYLKLFIARVL